MTRPEIQAPDAVDEGDGRVRETHPAFAVVSVTRSSGTPRALFQSDLRHQETIMLTISEAERIRDLNHDRVHPTRELVEIEMSLAQWGSVVSSIGLGSGVPVTLRRGETLGRVVGLPHLPRIRKNLDEVNSAVDKVLERAMESFAVLTEAIDGKKGVRAIREALRSHGFSLSGAKNNAIFAVTSLAEAAEFVTSQARADIEAHILAASRQTGQAPSIEASVFEPPTEISAISVGSDTPEER
jgi:hypothetical protein